MLQLYLETAKILPISAEFLKLSKEFHETNMSRNKKLELFLSDFSRTGYSALHLSVFEASFL